MSKRSEIRERRRRERQRRQLATMLVVGGAVLVFIAMVIIPNIQASDPEQRPLADATAMGDPHAPVVIEEFSDFQCPFCRRFHEEKLDQIVENYVVTGKVYFVFRNFAFIGEESRKAANASLCAAEQDQFWPYTDLLFANQTGENVGAFSDLRLQSFAEELGLDTDQFLSCTTEELHKDQVQADFQDAQRKGVGSTPSFLINDKLIVGDLPFADFQAAIEEALIEVELE